MGISFSSLATTGLAAVALASLLSSSRDAAAVTPYASSTSVTVTNPVNRPVPTQGVDNPALAPFRGNISINIANGSNSGGDNGNVTPGTQTLLVPAGKRLVVQTVSVYRSGAITSSNVQIYINTSVGGGYAAVALPIAPPSTAPYSGATLSAVFYADGGTELLANAFRDGTTGAENETVSVSGYLVNIP